MNCKRSNQQNEVVTYRMRENRTEYPKTAIPLQKNVTHV